MIKQNAIGSVHSIGFAVIHYNPIAVHLCHRIRAARIKGSGFLLRHFLDQSIEFTGGGLVEANFRFKSQDSDSLQQSKDAYAIDFRGVFGRIKTDFNVRLRAEIIYFIRLNLFNHSDQRRTIREIAIVKIKWEPLFMGVMEEMIDTCRIEQR